MTRTVQITEEPNVTGNAMLDGDYPDVLRAIMAGVQAANGEASRRGFGASENRHEYHSAVRSVSRLLHGAREGRRRGPRRGTPLHRLGHVSRCLQVPRRPNHTNCHGRFAPLSSLRRTGARGRSVTCRCMSPNTGGRRGRTGRQTDRRRCIRDVIETVLEHKDELDIAAYELFSLRDADSGNPDMFHQFGVMTDAYLPEGGIRRSSRITCALAQRRQRGSTPTARQRRD